MRQAKKDVKEYVKQCRAREERKKIQKQDQLFKSRDPARFHIPRQKATCRKLVVDGNTVTCEVDLLDCWKAHFSELAKSKLDANSAENRVESDLHARSFGHNDQVLDTPFTIEEIENAVKKLKVGKGGGFDGLQPEHIKYSGHSLLIWLQRIFNGIILLEDIPPSLKVGVTIPVFKGKGRDPLNPNNYRGITQGC